MTEKKKIEYRYYEIPKNELCLTLTGPVWNKAYGEGRDRLHFHNFYEVGVCYEGEGEMILGERECHFYKGCISIIPPSELHTTNTFGKTAGWEWMYFDAFALLNDIYPDDEIAREKVRQLMCKRGELLEPGGGTQKIHFLIQSIFSEMKTQEYMHEEMVRYFLIGLVIEIIRRLENHDIPDKVSVKNDIFPAIEYIKANYDTYIKISDLAKCCNMSESYFRRTFGKYMNMRPLDYLNFVRVQKSCSLLRDTQFSVSSVAERVGYESTSSFIRNFKRIIGCTPHQWKTNEKPESSKLYRYNITALRGWLE